MARNLGFAHHRLDLYALSLEAAQAAHVATRATPRGLAHIVDQLRRSSSALPLLIAEGAARRTPKQKRQRFVEAQGECAESAAAIEILCTLSAIPQDEADRILSTLTRIGSMLTKLICKPVE